MGLLNTLFSKNKKIKEVKTMNINWIPLTTLPQLKEIKEESKKEPIAIFKHSTRCGISRMVIKQFENSFDESLKNFKVYYLDLLNHRDISSEIEHQFKVLHQSPQLLIIKNEEVIAYASHSDITQIDLKRF